MAQAKKNESTGEKQGKKKKNVGRRQQNGRNAADSHSFSEKNERTDRHAVGKDRARRKTRLIRESGQRHGVCAVTTSTSPEKENFSFFRRKIKNISGKSGKYWNKARKFEIFKLFDVV